MGIDNDLYKGVLWFCTRDSSIKDWFLDSGRSILESEDNDEWLAIWKLYREKNKGIQAGKYTWNLNTPSDESASVELKNVRKKWY